MKLRRLLAGLSSGAAVLVAASAAHAIAAPPSCIPATLVPTTQQPIPVNIPGFGYTALAAQASDVHLFEGAGGADLGVTVGSPEGGLLKALPAAPLTPGTSYRIEFSSFCGYSTTPEAGPFRFTAAPAAPLPTRVGDAASPLVATAQDRGTGAFRVIGAFTLDPAMKPWASIYKLNVVVDGQVVPTKVTLSPAYDSASVVADGWCDAKLSSATSHTLQLRARLPFAATLDSDPVTSTFTCPASTVTTLPNDPATSPGTVPTGTAPGSTTSSASSGGCSAAPGRGASPFAALALSVGIALLVRRRRSGERTT
jgi:uncharacterized protein (TIGR03382 family)